MNINLNHIITLLVILVFAFSSLDIFFGNTPTAESHTSSNSFIDSRGSEVSLSNFSGNYLWVDYAAEWCSYCEPQTRTLKSLEKMHGDKLVFLTVVTGTGKVMEPPSAETAMNWARRFNLDPDKVLAHFSTKTLPYHTLYSPSGEILYQSSGLYNASKITNILKSHTPLFD